VPKASTTKRTVATEILATAAETPESAKESVRRLLSRLRLRALSSGQTPPRSRALDRQGVSRPSPRPTARRPWRPGSRPPPRAPEHLPKVARPRVSQLPLGASRPLLWSPPALPIARPPLEHAAVGACALGGSRRRHRSMLPAQ
jgi:hypothetical protein